MTHDEKADAFDQIVAARQNYLSAVKVYNERLMLVRAERERGNWSMNVTDEEMAMSEASKHASWLVNFLVSTFIAEKKD